MNFVAKKEKDLTIVSITGRMDAMTTPEAEDKLTELIGTGENKLIIDFQGLDYISSAGLRGILATAKKLKAEHMKRMMTLAAVSRKLLRIICAIVRDNSEYGVDYVLKRKVIKRLRKV